MEKRDNNIASWNFDSEVIYICYDCLNNENFNQVENASISRQYIRADNVEYNYNFKGVEFSCPVCGNEDVRQFVLSDLTEDEVELVRQWGTNLMKDHNEDTARKLTDLIEKKGE